MLRNDNLEKRSFRSFYITECIDCKELINIEICESCREKLFTKGEQGNQRKISHYSAKFAMRFWKMLYVMNVRRKYQKK